MSCMFYFGRFILLVQFVKYDVHTTRKIKFTHAIFTVETGEVFNQCRFGVITLLKCVIVISRQVCTMRP